MSDGRFKILLSFQRGWWSHVSVTGMFLDISVVLMLECVIEQHN